MRIHYSDEADALYILLKDTEIADTDEVAEDIILDYGEDGEVVGIEILSAAENANVEELVIESFGKVQIGAIGHKERKSDATPRRAAQKANGENKVPPRKRK